MRAQDMVDRGMSANNDAVVATWRAGMAMPTAAGAGMSSHHGDRATSGPFDRSSALDAAFSALRTAGLSKDSMDALRCCLVALLVDKVKGVTDDSLGFVSSVVRACRSVAKY